MSTLPRPTPSFTLAAAELVGEILRPVDPVIPSVGPDSFGRDAALPAGEPLAYSSITLPFAEMAAGWRSRIQAEQLLDVQVTHYRSATRTAPNGFTLRPTDGAFVRREGTALAYTQHAWSQLVGLLLQEVPNKPRGAAEPFRWLSPAVRAAVFAELKSRSRRREGRGHEILLRSHVDQATGLRALRAVLSGRHSGIHFDDLALLEALSAEVKADAPAYVSRGQNTTRGYAVLDSVGEVRAAISWVNSETGAASLGFSAGCYVSAIDARIVDGRVLTVDGEIAERDVRIASERNATRRAHTLPRARQTEETRAEIARARMQSDIRAASAASLRLCNDWRLALESFSGGHKLEAPTEREAYAQVVVDVIEERTRGFKAADRVALTALLTDDRRLRALPFLSAAHIAGAWAVLASKQTDWSEADRMHGEAYRWVTERF